MRRHLRLDNLLLAAVVGLVAYLAMVPAGYLLWEAFVGDGGLTLDHFDDAYRTVGLASMLGNSLWFAVGSSLLSLATGTGLAFLVVRTDLPFRRVMFVGALVPLIVPGILYTIAWIFLASPRSGALAEVLPVDPDVFGMGGMIFVEGLHLSPLVFLLMAAAFSSTDPALEEAALVSGASRSAVLRRITLPLARPAIYAALLIMIVRGLEAFEVPALLGIPAGTWVFTSRIWNALDEFPADLDAAAAYSVSLLVLVAVGVFAYSRLSGSGPRFESVTGRGHRPARIELGPWRRPFVAMTAGYLAVASVLPMLMLMYVSTQRFYEVPSVDGLSRLTASNYTALVENDATAQAFANSLLVGTGAATAVTILTAAAAWLVVRSRLPGRWMLDGLASLPLVIPGLVLGVSLLFLYLRSPLPIYGTLWILFIAYFTRFMPYGMRYAASAMHQIGSELEEAARASGASWAQTFRRITLPLLLPGLAAGWLYVLIVSMRELSSSILLYSPGSEVLPVRIFALYEGGEFTQLAALGVVLVLVLAALGALAYRLALRSGMRTG